MFPKNSLSKFFLSFLTVCVAFLSFSDSKAADSGLNNIYEISVGANIDSEVDDLGNTFVVYDKSGSVYLVKNRENEVLVGVGTSPTIAIDSTGSPHIAYINSGNVVYEIYDGDWDNQINVGIGTGASYVDIDTDSNCKAHLFYRAHYHNDLYAKIDLVYASNVSGSFSYVTGWNGEYYYSSGWGYGDYYSSYPISIKIDSSNNYHLVFWHQHLDKAIGWSDNTFDLQYHTNIAGRSINRSGDFALYKNSLTIDDLGRAHVLYGGIKHGLLSGGTWTSSDLIAGSTPAIYASNSSVAIAFVNSGVNYSENFGEGFSAPMVIDSLGTNPSVATNGTNRFVYYVKESKIYLATDKAIYNAPVISGVEEDGLYNTSKTITWDNGLGSINGIPVISGEVVTEDGSYQVVVTNAEGKSTTVNFTIDKTSPTITILPYNTDPTNQDVEVNATTNEGALNFASHTFTENGSFDFEATDLAGNKTTSTVTITNIDKTPPKITLSSYVTTPTNSDVIVNATTDEGILNARSHTFTENGSFTFEAIDAVGNKSQETITITNIDRLAPNITLSDYTKNPTNNDITVNASTDEGSLNSPSHTFTENGSFEFIATDDAGNTTSKVVNIDNIDKLEPSDVSITSPSPFTFVKQTIAIQAEAQDNESGIDKVEFYSTETGKISEDNLAPYVVDWNTSLVADGAYHLYSIAYDKADNTKTSATVITSVDNTLPVITIDPYTTDPTNEDVVVTASSNEGGLNQNSYTFTSNGTFDFVATDPAGNTTSTIVTVTNIDKEGPELTIAPYLQTPTNQDITVYASVTEGTLNSTSYTFTSNDEFEFIAVDSLGNQTSRIVKISNIDKDIPRGSIVDLDAGSYVRSVVSLVSNGEDDGLGVERVEFYHASDPTLIDTDYLAPYTADWDTAGVQDGIHKVWSVIYDKAGNRTTTPEVEIIVDNTAPIITISNYPIEPTTESIIVNATTNEGALNATSYMFVKNGSFDFVAIDQAGNKTVKTVTINNIYVATPSGPLNPVEESSDTSPVVDQTSPERPLGEQVVVGQVAQIESLSSQSGDALTTQALNTEVESASPDPADTGDAIESQSRVKGESTEKPKTGWWRWWYLLIIALIGGSLFIVSRKKNLIKES